MLAVDSKKRKVFAFSPPPPPTHTYGVTQDFHYKGKGGGQGRNQRGQICPGRQREKRMGRQMKIGFRVLMNLH